MSIFDESEPIPPEDPPAAEFLPEVLSSAEFIPETTPPITETVAPPPPVEAPIEKEERLKPADRSTMSQSTMIFGLMALSLSMLGGAFLMYDAFQNGLPDNLLSALVKVVPVILAYLVGWSLCLLSMRTFSNLVLPLLIRYYLWVALTGLVILYLKIMQKLFDQTYDFAHFFSYNMILAAGVVGMIGLHLLLEEQNLRRHSIPLIMACTWHLILMILRFVVIDQSDPLYLFGDLYFFIVMFGLATLMLAHLGILNPLRRLANTFFQPPQNRGSTA